MRREFRPRSCSDLVVSAALAALLGAQARAQPSAPPPVAPSTASALETRDSAAEVMAAEARLEEATTLGDTAYFATAVADDMLFVHRTGWTTGGKPRTDDKTSYGKRVADKIYLLNEIDPSTSQVELHGDIAITHGRYISMFWPNAGERASMSSIWYERVWAKRDGRWIFLSHRTVHGPSLSPAGVDPTLSSPDTQVWYLTDPAPPASPKSRDEAELLTIDRTFADSFEQGDARAVARRTSADFVMVNDERWTRGRMPPSVDSRQTLLERIAGRYYDSIDIDHTQVEMHGDVAITTGRYLAHTLHGDDESPDRTWSAAWFVRVYQKRNGQWIWLSHRTVHGPTYGASREAVSET
jgi:ketosteroid isomerase-like protein